MFFASLSQHIKLYYISIFPHIPTVLKPVILPNNKHQIIRFQSFNRHFFPYLKGLKHSKSLIIDFTSRFILDIMKHDRLYKITNVIK